MSHFKENFPNRHAVIPVIHVETEKQTRKNAEIAYNSGADGIFLISMNGMNHKDLLQMHDTIRNEYSTWFIGINCLDLKAVSVFNKINNNVSGVWTDNAHISEWIKEQPTAELIKTAQKNSGYKGLYFGGVAFKYQEEVKNPALVAKIATKYMDVITTSGIKTGSAPDIAKISIMKEAIEQHPLAIASGITPENIKSFLPITDAFLVASSITDPLTEEIDVNKIKKLINTVRSF